MSNVLFTRIAVAAGGILGLVGIIAAAGAAHAGDEALLGPLALIALTQAAAVLALALYAGATRLMQIATGIIAAGALLFSADLGIHHLTGSPPFPMAAPIGGTALILGWALVIAAAFTLRR